MSAPSSLRVWLNGRLRPLSDARVSVFDRGLLFGDGIYETLRAYRGRAFRVRQHLLRLQGSARRLSLPLAGVAGGIARGMVAVLRANRLQSARVRVVVTRGQGDPDLLALARGRPTVLIYALPYEPPPVEAYRDGVRAVIAPVVRNDRLALDPAIKSSNLLNNLLAGRGARRAGAREAIMLNPRGYVAEAASANVFFVRRGRLCTPALSTGILAGITRDLVIDLARRLGLPVREGLYRLPALLGAEEVFVTASTIEVLPVASIRVAPGSRSGLPGIGEGRSVGPRRYPRSRPYTRALQEAYRVTVDDELGF